jgi:hypothetical protein
MTAASHTRPEKATQWAPQFVLRKGEGNIHPRLGHEGPRWEYRYSSTLSLTSAIDGVGGQRHAPADLPLERDPLPVYRRLGGPQCRAERVRKISPLTGIRSPDGPARSESLYRLNKCCCDFKIKDVGTGHLGVGWGEEAKYMQSFSRETLRELYRLLWYRHKREDNIKVDLKERLRKKWFGFLRTGIRTNHRILWTR